MLYIARLKKCGIIRTEHASVLDVKEDLPLENTGHSFISYFKRATSPLVVLRFLSEKPMYGYEISAELKNRSDGKYLISILYPVLYRLEEQGFIEISSTEVAEGRARSYYSITEAGREHLARTWREYLAISETFEHLMKP